MLCTEQRLYSFSWKLLIKPFPGESNIDLSPQTGARPADAIIGPDPTAPTFPTGPSKTTETVQPQDPNALVGPAGYGMQGFIQPTGTLPYTIDFENDGSVAAQDVTVTEQLDASLDWSTFQLGSFGFGTVNVAIPAGLTQYQTTVSYQNSDGSSLNVQISLDFNVATGLLTVSYVSIDPLTGQTPTGVFDGFLYPESESPVGSDGYVQYTVQLSAGLTTGTTINQQASVVFDTNAPLNTAVVTNTIDTGPPTSSVAALPATESTPSFTVSWSGSDDPSGSGIATYAIYDSDNGGSYQVFMTATAPGSATFTGQAGHTYSFYSVATDNVGNVQPTPTTAQATTTVQVQLSQTISFGPLAGQTYGVAPITLSATDTSGLPVSFSVISGPATLSGNVLTVTAAGNVVVEASQAGNTTYSAAAPVDDSFTVSPALLTITPTAGQFMVYGGTVPALTYTYTGLVNGDSSATFSGGLVTTATSSSGVGDYPITQGTLAATGNYTIGTFNAGTLTVTPAPLTIMPTAGQSMVYGGTVPALTYTYSGLVNGDTSATFSGGLVTAATSSSGVGSYAITQGTLTATGNYTIGTFNAGTLTVNAAQLIVTAANESMTYGGTVPALTYTYTGLVNGDTSATFSGSLVTTATSSSGVGGYAITEGTLTATGNYTIGTFNAGAVTVNAAQLTVTAANESMTYGGTVPALTYTYSGLVNGDTSATFSGSLVTTATSSSGVGGYAITQGTLTATGNYTIDTFGPGTLTVNAAPLTITANNDSKTYGTLKTFSSTAFTESGLVNGDTITGVTETSTGAPVSAPVGTDLIVPSAATGTGLGNYTIGYINGTLTVNPATLTVTANNDSKTYGTLKTFSSTAFTETGLVAANGDTITGVTETSTGAPVSAPVGTDPIVPSAAAGTGLSNYTIDYINGTLTVNPATLIITANNATKVYGAPLPLLGASYSGFVNGDTAANLTTRLTLATSATRSSHVQAGGYQIAASGASDPDYAITYQPGTLLITPAPLTVTANNATKVYGAGLPPLTYAIGGFVNGDTASAIGGVPAITTTATASSHVSSSPYPITVTTGSLSASDYTFVFVGGVQRFPEEPKHLQDKDLSVHYFAKKSLSWYAPNIRP